jgi:hypothetical protein
MKWVTREKARVDRIACPWLISRFIDKEPTFLFVPSNQVRQVAERAGAIPTIFRTWNSVITGRAARSMRSSTSTS